MINDHAQQALKSLQQQASTSSDTYVQERAERALDEIVRNHQNGRPAAFQIRSALAHAGETIAHRRAIVQITSLHSEAEGRSVAQEPGVIDGGYALVDLIHWLHTTPALTASERRLMLSLAEGEDAESIACELGVPVARIRERVSRVRKVARSAYRLEVTE